jgi:hypothetical protein
MEFKMTDNEPITADDKNFLKSTKHCMGLVKTVATMKTDSEIIANGKTARCSDAIDEKFLDEIQDLYQQGLSITKISQKLNLPYSTVYHAIHNIFRNERAVITKNEELARKNIEWSFRVADKIIEKMNELDRYMKQLKYVDPETGELNVNLKWSAAYLNAWKLFSDSLRWWLDKKVELSGMQEAQEFRDAVIESIRDEDPKIAAKIKAIIDQKKRERGML